MCLARTKATRDGAACGGSAAATADAVTPMLTGSDVVASLLAYIAVYIIVFGAGIYYLVRLVQRGFASDMPLALLDKRPERALSGVTD